MHFIECWFISINFKHHYQNAETTHMDQNVPCTVNIAVDLSLVIISTDPAWTVVLMDSKETFVPKVSFFFLLHLSRFYTDSILLHVMIYLSYCVLTWCDFGYYGFECRDQCSSFCNTSRDCDHVTGFCIDGCKSGRRGNDCLEGNCAFSSFNSHLRRVLIIYLVLIYIIEFNVYVFLSLL